MQAQRALKKLSATFTFSALCLLLQPFAAKAQSTPTVDTSAALDANLREAFEQVPVTVKLFYGGERTGHLIVSHFRPAGDGPFPFVVFNHGRGPQRAEPARYRSLNLVRYFTRRGFAVFVTTRMGYGATGTEPDTEESGLCNRKNYGPMFDAAVTQTQRAIEFAKSMSWVDRSRLVLIGQSVGGFTTVMATGQPIEGLKAAINFAGGSGGDPIERPAAPCDYSQLGFQAQRAGKGASVPMLWMYAENDRYWGAQIPLKWHEAYVGSGGKAKMVMLPKVSENGHNLLGEGFTAWRPIVDDYLQQSGFAIPKMLNAPPPTNFANLNDLSKVPLISDEARNNGYKRFLNTDIPRAFVIGPGGQWSYQSGVDGLAVALERCAASAKQACKPYAVDDAVVWVP
jgi:dienelactone hydrolase